MYHMIITSDDPDRFLPISWNFEPDSDNPEDVWKVAMDIAKAEKVNVIRIIDDYGREIWC